MAGRGRGRAATLPAWMTKSGGVDAAKQEAAAVAAAPAPSPSPAPAKSEPSGVGTAMAMGAPSHASGRPGGVGVGNTPFPGRGGWGGAPQAQPQAGGFPGAGFPPAAMPPPVLAPPKLLGEGWEEHKTAEGKPYYFHRATNKTQWVKPEEVKTPEEKALDASPWTEHTANGRTYYHNKETNKSVWVEPDELKELKRKAKASVAKLKPVYPPIPVLIGPYSLTNQPKKVVMPLPKVELTEEAKKAQDAAAEKLKAVAEQAEKEFNSFAAKKAEYERLVEIKKSKGKKMKKGRVFVDPTVAPVPEIHVHPYVEKPTPAPKPVPVLSDPEEAAARFKAALDSSGVTSSMDWTTAMRHVMPCKEWAMIRSLAQKKSIFDSFREEHKEVEEKRRAEKLAALKGTFKKLLETTPGINSKTRWREAQELLQDEEAYQQMGQFREARHDMFDDYVYALEKAERATREAARQQKKKAFFALLDELTPEHINGRSTLRDMGAVEKFASDTRNKVCDDIDRESWFKRHVRALLAAEEAEKKKKRDAKLAADKAAAAAFEAFLRTKVETKEITAISSWKKYSPSIEDSEELKAMADNEVSTARSVFDKVVDELYVPFRADRRVVKALLRRANLEVGPQTTYQAFVNEVVKFEAAHPPEEGEEGSEKLVDGKLPFAALLEAKPDTVRLVFDQLHEAAVEEAARVAKKVEKRQARFKDLLTEYFYRSDHVGTSWDDAVPKLRSHTAYKDLRNYPEARQAAFTEYMAELEKALAATAVAGAGEGAGAGAEDSKKRPRDEEEGEVAAESSTKRARR